MSEQRDYVIVIRFRWLTLPLPLTLNIGTRFVMKTPDEGRRLLVFLFLAGLEPPQNLEPFEDRRRDERKRHSSLSGNVQNEDAVSGPLGCGVGSSGYAQFGARTSDKLATSHF